MGALDIFGGPVNKQRMSGLLEAGYTLGSKEFRAEYKRRYGEDLYAGDNTNTEGPNAAAPAEPSTGNQTKAIGRNGPGQAPRPGARGETGRLTGLDKADPDLGADERRRGRGGDGSLGQSAFRKTLLGE